jgi:hypothetical protein
LLTLNFKVGRNHVIGPASAWLEFCKGDLRTADTAQPIASYTTRGWIYRGVEYPEIECRAFLFVELLRDVVEVGQRIGPRPVLRVRNSRLFAGRELVATYSTRTGLWMGANRTESWAAIRVSAAE